jgi:hypothetical protein
VAQERVTRVVAVGASNLTRGFHAVVAAARQAWGPDVDVLVALGNGRSFGSPSMYFARGLPGILHSGLWRELESQPPAPTRALITDVGNDILYGFPPAQLLEWVDDCAARVARFAQDIVVTGLPPATMSGLSPGRYLFFRSVFFPRCRLSFVQTMDAARAVQSGLEDLASRRGLRFCELKPEWYGLDPIHIRPGKVRPAWQEILGGDAPGGRPRRAAGREALRLFCLQPERASYFGVERHTPQRGRALRAGGRVWLY